MSQQNSFPSARGSLRTDVPRRFARPEQRLHDTGVNRVDLSVAIHVELTEVAFVGRAQGSLNETGVHRIHLPLPVNIAVAEPLRIPDAIAGLELERRMSTMARSH